MKIAPRKVLLIDSEMLIHLAVSQAYRDAGPYFITASSAGEALKKMEIFSFDLFLLALDLKDQQSLQLLQILDERFPDAPVIMMSNNETEYCELVNQIEKTKRQGNWQLIEKPFNLDILAILIERSLYERDRNKDPHQFEEQDGSEKRNNLRRSYVQSIQLSIDASDRGYLEEKTVKATLTDVSDGGFGLITKYPLVESQPIKLGDSSGSKYGIVAWTSSLDNHICRAGIQFC